MPQHHPQGLHIHPEEQRGEEPDEKRMDGEKPAWMCEGIPRIEGGTADGINGQQHHKEEKKADRAVL